ncbi:MAG: hypothetical protein FJ290_28000 [Planctomycetes bacterium]|nr:hypothetical protein [Planctomycetota bacterium]
MTSPRFPWGSVLSLLVCLSSAHALAAAQGWRGDGSGKYPDADPPITWSRISKAVSGLRYPVENPTEVVAGKPMRDGVAREWLVLGPVPLPPEAKVENDTLPNESDFAPVEGDKVGELAWKKVAADAALLDFAALFGKRPSGVAYAFTNLFSETGGAFRLNLTYVGGVRIVVNGKPGPPFCARAKITLAKGWNRILLKASPGEQGDWFLIPILHACPPADYEETGIAWKAVLPGAHPGFYGAGMGVGSPVVAGDRLYLLSEPHDLICLRKSDGKVLWLRTNSYLDAATEEERKSPTGQEAAAIAVRLDAINAELLSGPLTAKQCEEKVKLEKELYQAMRQTGNRQYRRGEIPDVGYSGFAPVTDGQLVWAWFATGVSACYDLDGHRKWIRVDNRPAVEHGFSSSPILADGKLVVFMRDLMAFDAKTGAVAWQTPVSPHQGLNPAGFFHGTPLATAVGGVPVIALGNDSIVRASDGRVVYTPAGYIGAQCIASPVADAGTLFLATSGSMQFLLHTLPESFSDPLKLATRTMKLDVSAWPKYYMPWHLSSPIVHDGLAYLLNNSGVLTVVDLKTVEVIYQKLLDLDHFQWVNEGAARGIGISPVLAGSRIYILGNNGGSVVIEPGRTFKQLAKNKLENAILVGHWAERQERFVANPVPDGKRLYVRGEATLYALGPP